MKNTSRTDDQTPLCLENTEKAVIGLLLCDPVNAWPKVKEARLSGASFTDPTCRIIFGSMQEADQKHPGQWDSATVAELLNKSGNLEDIGGHERLIDWPNQWAPWQGVVGTHADELRNAEILRKIHRHTLVVQQTLTNPDLTLAEKIEFATDIPDFRKIAGVSTTPPTLAQLVERYPEPTPILIDGLLRQRELMLIAAPSKFGKSFLSYSLIRAFLRGEKWLGSFDCFGDGKRVLLFDNEVQSADLTQRLKWVLRDCPTDRLFVHCVRTDDGRSDSSVATIAAMMSEIRPALTICDAIYKCYPVDGRFDENSNADVTRFLTTIEAAAAKAGSAVAMVHHSTKGSQGAKHSRDVGSGAGAWTRSPDTQLAIVEHEEDDCAIVTANNRTFRKRDPIGIRLDRETMRWELDESLDVTLVRGVVSAEERGRKNRDAREKLREETLKTHETKVLRALTQHGRTWLTKDAVLGHSGLSPANNNGALVRLVASGVVAQRPGKKRGWTEYLLAERVAEVAAIEQERDRNSHTQQFPLVPPELSGSGSTEGDPEPDNLTRQKQSGCRVANDTGNRRKPKGKGKARRNRTAPSKD
ncbi:MAG: AAA family ATPase [Planctomycetaceae bacterium]